MSKKDRSQHSYSSNSSSMFEDYQKSPDEEKLHAFVKQMLQTRVFIGTFKERRYVDQLRTYRDVIVIDSTETKLKEDLSIVKKRLHEYYLNEKFIGISAPQYLEIANAHCLWVTLHEEIALGKYWFQIKSIKYRDNEIYVRLRTIRPVDPDINISNEIDITNDESSENKEIEVDWSQYFENLKKSTNQNLYVFLTTMLTLHNIIEVLKFIMVLIVALLTGLVNAVYYIGEYYLKFMREISYFVNAATPMFLGVVDFFSKMVGGFYILIAMIFRGSNTQTKNFMGPANRRPLPPIRYR